MNGVFKIDLSGVAPCIEVDGTKFTNVADIRVSQAHGEFPKVLVLFDAHTVQIEGAGEVALETVGPTPAEFLNSVDIDGLAKEAMEQSSFGESPMAVFIETLKARANA